MAVVQVRQKDVFDRTKSGGLCLKPCRLLLGRVQVPGQRGQGELLPADPTSPHRAPDPVHGGVRQAEEGGDRHREADRGERLQRRLPSARRESGQQGGDSRVGTAGWGRRGGGIMEGEMGESVLLLLLQ